MTGIQELVREELDDASTVAVIGLSLEMFLSIMNKGVLDIDSISKRYPVLPFKSGYLTVNPIKQKFAQLPQYNNMPLVNKEMDLEVFIPSIVDARNMAVRNHLYTIFSDSLASEDLAIDIIEGQFYDFTTKEALKIYYPGMNLDYTFFEQQCALAMSKRGLLVGINEVILGFEGFYAPESDKLTIAIPNGLTKEIISSVVPLGQDEIAHFGVLPNISYQRLVYFHIFVDEMIKNQKIE